MPDADHEEKERKREQARSVSRGSKFVLSANHVELKQHIEKREAELKKILEDYNANHFNLSPKNLKEETKVA